MTKIEKILEEIHQQRKLIQDDLDAGDQGDEDWNLNLEIWTGQITVLNEIYNRVKEIGQEPG